ncbi:MAG: pyridoxal-phosphate dependent enzyme, partial [Anaerolineales bacterium]|nr:pyridoxal-phosphate dependent enzyme [Anaerolineales bacterium]
GNLLLDRLLGAELRWTGNRPRDEVFAEVVAAERDAGRRVYAIPLGGSTALGAAAYAAAMLELAQQQQAQHVAFDRVVFASSSGGTQAGLVVGASLRAARGTQAFTGELLGISVDLAEAELKALVADLATATATLLGMPRVYSPVGIHVNADYLGEGYAVMGEPEREAIELFARCEGLLLDPVYTGRAAAGLLDLIRRG